MDVELNLLSTFWEMEDAVKAYEYNDDIDFDFVNKRIEELLHGAESCQEMINNRRKLSNEEFYKLLNNFGRVHAWNDYDCQKVLELACKTKFAGKEIIPTTMHTIIQKTEGHGRDFSWWDEEVGINFKIFYTEDFNFDNEHAYTKEEIKRLIEEKKIFLVSEAERNYPWDLEPYKEEEYESFECAYDDIFSKEFEFLNEKGKYYKYTLQYIRKCLNKRKLERLFKNHMDHVNYEVYSTTNGQTNGSNWAHVASVYKNEFEEKGYSRRLQKLNEKN